MTWTEKWTLYVALLVQDYRREWERVAQESEG